MKPRAMILTIFLSLGVIGMIGQSSFAQTGTGLHFTPEEVAIWQKRKVSGPYKSAWDKRILPNAKRFRSNPSAERWKGWTSGGCWQHHTAAGRYQGDKLRDAAFVYLIDKDNAYRDAVRNELLAQASEPGTNFADTGGWCTSSKVANDLRAHDVTNWLRKLAYGYSYIRDSVSNADKTTLDRWFRDAAWYWHEGISNNVIRDQRFSKRDQNDYSVCDGWACPSNFIGKTHWKGWDTHWFSQGWNNRAATAISFAAATAIMVDDAALKAKCKRWIFEFIKYGMYRDGTVTDQYRWNNSHSAVAAAFGYANDLLTSVLTVADHFARIGDTELYDWTTTEGMFGSEGGPKSLLLAMQRMAGIVNNKVEIYASKDSTLTPNERIRWNVENGKIEDTAMAQSNIYFQDPEVRQAYTRQLPDNPSCGGYNCWGGDWGTLPDVLFMFGQMGGKVWPYPTGDTPSKPLVPERLRIVQE